MKNNILKMKENNRTKEILLCFFEQDLGEFKSLGITLGEFFWLKKIIEEDEKCRMKD